MADPAARYKYGGWIGAAVVAVLVYQSYVNTQMTPSLQRMSRESACATGTGCVVEGDSPLRFSANAFRQEYTWGTAIGDRIVRCRRAQIWMGAWSCKVQYVAEPRGPAKAPGPAPADPKRGAPAR